MNKITLLLAVLCGTALQILAQSGQNPVNIQLNEIAVRALTDPGYLATAVTFDQRYEGVKGTPLLFENWKEGILKIKDKEEMISSIKMNINFQQQLAAVCYQNGAVGVLPSAKIESITFETDGESHRFILLPGDQVEAGRGPGLRFYEALFEGRKFTFIKAHIRQFKKADYQGAYASNVRYDEYVPEEAYYLRQGDGPFTKIRLRKSVVEKQLAAWKLSVPASAAAADLNTEKGVLQLLQALEQQE